MIAHPELLGGLIVPAAGAQTYEVRFSPRLGEQRGITAWFNMYEERGVQWGTLLRTGKWMPDDSEDLMVEVDLLAGRERTRFSGGEDGMFSFGAGGDGQLHVHFLDDQFIERCLTTQSCRELNDYESTFFAELPWEGEPALVRMRSEDVLRRDFGKLTIDWMTPDGELLKTISKDSWDRLLRFPRALTQEGQFLAIGERATDADGLSTYADVIDMRTGEELAHFRLGRRWLQVHLHPEHQFVRDAEGRLLFFDVREEGQAAVIERIELPGQDRQRLVKLDPLFDERTGDSNFTFVSVNAGEWLVRLDAHEGIRPLSYLAVPMREGATSRRRELPLPPHPQGWTADSHGMMNAQVQPVADQDGDGTQDILILGDLYANRDAEASFVWWVVSGATGEVVRR